MTRRHVLDRLPLWAGDDLPRQEREAIQTHLDRCVDCRTSAGRLRDSQAWLQEDLEAPFDAADYASLRETVMARVRQEATPRPVARLVPRTALLATAATLLVLALVLPWRQAPQGPSVPAPPLPVAAAGALAPRAATRPAPPGPTAPQVAHARTIPLKAPEEGAGPTRIEFQTSDPTVRIIWLAQATPPSDPNPSLPEAP